MSSWVQGNDDVVCFFFFFLIKVLSVEYKAADF